MNIEEKVYKIALKHALKKIKKNMGDLKDSFPFVTVNGKWEICKEEDWNLNIFSDGYWCNGFWIGMLWLAGKVTKNDKFKMKAYELCKLIEPRKNSNKTHDLGFLFYPSFCVGYDITKANYLKSVGILFKKYGKVHAGFNFSKSYVLTCFYSYFSSSIVLVILSSNF